MNIGASNRLIYDNCSYQKRLKESTTPLEYQLYQGKHENCNKCTDKDVFWTPYALVDIETELRNQTRPMSHCDRFKYNPNCQHSGLCLSTFDKDIPVAPAPEVCPIIFNNIPRQTSPGYSLPTMDSCFSRHF